MVRTVLGEAGNQGDEGQSAVAHVILNRVRDGGYGKTASDVVLAPSQFEPWSTRARELNAINPRSPGYQRAKAIVEDAASGESEDPTNGATHFLQPDIVMERYGKLPNWAQGRGQRIGDHVFFSPGVKAINAAIKTDDSMPSNAMAFNSVDQLFDSYAQPKSAPAVSADPKKLDSDLDSIFGSQEKVAKAVAPAPVQMIGNETADQFREAHLNPPPNKPDPGILSRAGDYGLDVLKRMGTGISENAGNALKTIGEGVSDVAQGRSATGVGKVGLGSLMYPFSLINGPLDVAGEEIGRASGNPEFGKRATLLVPGRGALKVAQELRPEIGAVKDLVKDIGAENLPSVIARLEKNPKLTLMDVAPVVQGNAAGLATDPRNVKAMDQLRRFSKERMAERGIDVKGAFEDVLGPTPNMKKTIDDLENAARETGKKLIEPAVEKAKYVDVTPIVKGIDEKFDPAVLKALKAGESPKLPMSEDQKRLWELRQRLRGNLNDRDEMFMTGEQAHKLQKELRAKWGSDMQHGYEARDVRRQLIGAIDEATGGTVAKPGAYRSALKEYADDKATREAFNEGFGIFANPTSAEKSIANHPDMWKAWVEDASKSELEALKKGILFGANTRVQNMRKGIDIPKDSFAHERLAAVLGDAEAGKIVDKLNDWRDISATDNLIRGNSATALRKAGQKRREVREAKPASEMMQKFVPPLAAGVAAHVTSGQPLLGGAALLATAGGAKLANILGKTHDLAANRAYAELASATGMKKQDLLAVLRNEMSRANAITPREKLLNLIPPSVLHALPR